MPQGEGDTLIERPDFNSWTDDAFVRHVREFVDKNCPPHLRFPGRRLPLRDVRPWYDILSREGWICPQWPREYGGMGLDAVKSVIFLVQMELVGAPRLPDNGILSLGPLLIKMGTDRQRQLYLPAIREGRHIWAQGYSEPNAGSDLASLSTHARVEGDRLIIDGQKIWTSWASDATHMFALVRDSAAGESRKGITFVLLDLAQPGVRVVPIRNLRGHDEFCQVFFDGAIATVDDVVGKRGEGWAVAKSLLGFERLSIGAPRLSRGHLAELEVLARASGLLADPLFVDRLAQLRMDVEDLEAAFQGYVAAYRSGLQIGADISALKIWNSETAQRICEFMVEVSAEAGGASRSIDGRLVDPVQSLLESRSYSILGGSNEIQRNVLAKSVLGLPG